MHAALPNGITCLLLNLKCNLDHCNRSGYWRSMQPRFVPVDDVACGPSFPRSAWECISVVVENGCAVHVVASDHLFNSVWVPTQSVGTRRPSDLGDRSEQGGSATPFFRSFEENRRIYFPRSHAPRPSFPSSASLVPKLRVPRSHAPRGNA